MELYCFYQYIGYPWICDGFLSLIRLSFQSWKIYFRFIWRSLWCILWKIYQRNSSDWDKRNNGWFNTNVNNLGNLSSFRHGCCLDRIANTNIINHDHRTSLTLRCSSLCCSYSFCRFTNFSIHLCFQIRHSCNTKTKRWFRSFERTNVENLPYNSRGKLNKYDLSRNQQKKLRS